MSSTPARRALRSAVIVFFAAALLGGCGRVTQLPAQPAATTPLSAPAAPRQQQYAADDSACHWSLPACIGGCGGGVGQELITPAEDSSDAIVAQLAGDSPAFSHDGELVATIGNDQVHVWGADGGDPVQDLPGEAFVFSPGGSALAVKQGQEWAVWDTAAWEEQYRLADSGSTLYFSTDGSTIVIEDDNSRVVRVYDATSGSVLQEFDQVFAPTAVSGDGTLLATTAFTGSAPIEIQTIAIWDVHSGDQLQELQPEITSKLPLSGVRGHYLVNSLAFSPDGQALLSAGPEAVRLWDTSSGQHLRCFQTPLHTGADQAFWGAEPEIIIGIAAKHADSLCTCGFRQDNQQDVYVWNTTAAYPAGMIGLGEDPASVAPGLVQGEDGNVVTWRGYNSDYPSFGQRNAFLWDPKSQQLWGVLPTDGNMVQAALSPAGDRAVTVSVFGDPNGSAAPPAEGASDAPAEGGSALSKDTMLWDTKADSVAAAAAAQQSYWGALEAAADGKPLSVQQRALRKAQALSPELFSAVDQVGESAVASYSDYLARLGQVQDLADGVEPATGDFNAAIRDTSPAWLTWRDRDRVEQVLEYFAYADLGGAAERLAAYQDVAALDPTTAGSGQVIDSLLSAVAPDAAALARAGNIAEAAAEIKKVLAAYPAVKIDAKHAAQQVYAQAVVIEGRTAAADGDLQGAVAKFKAALKLDSSLGIDPKMEATQIYTRTLLIAGQQAGEAGDLVGAAGKFGEAVTLDPALAAAPPAYVQIFCVAGSGSSALENAAGLCENVDAAAEPMALGDFVDGEVAQGAVGFWSIDVADAMQLGVDVQVTSGALYPHLYLIGPDGAIIADKLGDDSGVSFTADLPQAGTYLVAVAGDDSSGTYVLSVYDANVGQG